MWIVAEPGEGTSLYPGIGLWVGENEKPVLYDSNLNLSAPFGHAVEVCKETTRTLRAGDRMELNGTNWEVLDTSGHSPGGVSFYCAQAGVAVWSKDGCHSIWFIDSELSMIRMTFGASDVLIRKTSSP